jgi:hypothetical protein
MTKSFFQERIGNCKFSNKCLCSIKNSYEEIDTNEFFIFDDDSDQPSTIVLNSKQFQLRVKNPKNKLITFAKVDKCILPEEKGKKKCDCFLFDNAKLFFVEIKSTNPKGRKEARREAILQLEHTIRYFISKEVNVSKLYAKAVICFKNINSYPIKSSQKSQQAMFKINYNVSLEEGNLIEF